MDHGGEAARPTTVESADLGMAGAVQGGEAHSHMSTGTFHVQRGADAARRAIFDGFGPSAAAFHDSNEFARHVVVPVPVDVSFHLHHEPGPGLAYAYNNIGEFWRQLGLVDVALLGLHLPDGVVQVLDNYGYSALQPRPGTGRGVVLAVLLPGGGGGVVYNGDYELQPRQGAGRGEVLVDLLPDGAGHGEGFVGQLPGGGVAAYDNYVYYALQPCPGAGHGEVLVDLLPDGAGHGEAFVGHLPGGGVSAYGDYGYYALQPRPVAGHGEVLVDLLPDGAGHGEVFVGLLPGGGVTVHDDYGYNPWQPRPSAGRDEVFIGSLPDGVGVVFDGSGNLAWQALPAPGTRGADEIAGALHGPNLGAVYDNRGVVGEHLRHLLPFVGIGASSMAVNGLAAGPGSPAVVFHLFLLLLGGLFLVILHVLRV